VEADRVELVISDAILREIEEVLNRTNIQNKFPQLSADRVAAFLGRISNMQSQ
jgi:predicted nucleic acid-binding protein